MAISVNKVVLVGRLGADPQTFGQEGQFTKLRLATSERWKNSKGDSEERTTWHSVVIWQPAAAKFAAKYLKKGDLAYVEGQVETRKYDKDGTEVYVTEIVVRPFTGSVQAEKSSGQKAEEREEKPAAGREDYSTGYAGVGRSDGFARDLDDEIPF